MPRSSHWTNSPNAPKPLDQYTTVKVTHPFHPLFGREYLFVSYGHNWGEYRVCYKDEAGLLASLPASWTDVVAPDPVVVVSEGKAYFRLEDLRGLASLLSGLGSGREDTRRRSKNRQ